MAMAKSGAACSDCGCFNDGGMPKFCANPEHTIYPCGCMNLGGNFIQCTKHYNRPILIGVLILLLVVAIVCINPSQWLPF